MQDTATQSAPKSATTPSAQAVSQAQETDGFQLVIDALKLNGVDTIFGLPGIPKNGRRPIFANAVGFPGYTATP